MKIFFLLSIITITILYISRKVIYSAKRNLFKDQAAWSSNNIKIKYSNSKENSSSKSNDNYLKIIADESKIYLEDQSRKEE
tara:strand:- start:398 stop:640 length:243 start_codon:yes stop_codon:yes gene_type:complete